MIQSVRGAKCYGITEEEQGKADSALEGEGVEMLVRQGEQGSSCWEGYRRDEGRCVGNSVSGKGNSQCKGSKARVCAWYAPRTWSKPVWLKQNER